MPFRMLSTAQCVVASFWYAMHNSVPNLDPRTAGRRILLKLSCLSAACGTPPTTKFVETFDGEGGIRGVLAIETPRLVARMYKVDISDL